MPDLYQEVSDLKMSCSESQCSGALVKDLEGSNSKIFEKLADAHSVVTAADEEAATTERRKKRGLFSKLPLPHSTHAKLDRHVLQF